MGGSVRQRHGVGPLGQIHGQPVAHRPANHGTRVEVKDPCKIEPAFGGPEVGEVPGPHPIRKFDRELVIEGVRGHGQLVIRGWGRATASPSWPGDRPDASAEPPDARRHRAPA